VDHDADERAVAQARERARVDGGEQGALFLAVQHRRAALRDDVLRPAYRVRRIRVDDLAHYEPVKKHSYRRKVLFYGRFCKPGQKALDIARDMHGLHMRQIVHAALGAEF
jgi:hypothetical protein